jgi:CheY-like chemotaxis protein/anti-sigma regulatory factor (Ser/Thr protein kinase)
VALESARPRAEEKGLRVEYVPASTPLYVDADPERLTQILDNLLRNAVTYTDKGSIGLRVAAEDGVARFTVQDTGIGVESHEIPLIFHAYQQRRVGQRSGGLGLGLALVQALVEAHSGAVSVESDGPGRGSRFSFTVPLANGPSASTKRSSVATRPVSRRILVVDDQRDVADSLGFLLRTLGQDVEVTYNGKDALASAKKRPPHVAFVDLAMPGMSGVEVARKLRKNHPELALVALTGDSAAHAAPQAPEFTHSLLKPVNEDLLTTLLHYLPTGPEPMASRRKPADSVEASE